jgi:hypothetical protein
MPILVPGGATDGDNFFGGGSREQPAEHGVENLETTCGTAGADEKHSRSSRFRILSPDTFIHQYDPHLEYG